jgi:hypothetical protein
MTGSAKSGPLVDIVIPDVASLIRTTLAIDPAGRARQVLAAGIGRKEIQTQAPVLRS